MTARGIVARGGRAAVFDRDGARAEKTARSLSDGRALSFEGAMRPCRAGCPRDPNGVVIELLELPRSAE